MTEQEVKEKFDELYTKYQQTMEMLVDALDNITLLEKQLDKKPKEVIIEKEVVIEPRPEIVKTLALLQKKYDKTLKALEDKPKEVIVEKEIEIIKEIEVEVEKVVEKIVEVEIPRRQWSLSKRKSQDQNVLLRSPDQKGEWKSRTRTSSG